MFREDPEAAERPCPRNPPQSPCDHCPGQPLFLRCTVPCTVPSAGEGAHTGGQSNSHLLWGVGAQEGHERRHGLDPVDLPPGHGAWRAWGGCASCVDLDPGWSGWTERRGPAAEPGFLGVVRGGGTGGWARPGCAGGQSGRTPAPSAEGKNWGHLQEKARVWCVGVRECVHVCAVCPVL